MSYDHLQDKAEGNHEHQTKCGAVFDVDVSSSQYQVAMSSTSSFPSKTTMNTTLTMNDSARDYAEANVVTRVCSRNNVALNAIPLPHRRNTGMVKLGCVMLKENDDALVTQSWSGSKYRSLQTALLEEDEDDIDSRDASPIRDPIHCFRVPSSARTPVTDSLNAIDTSNAVQSSAAENSQVTVRFDSNHPLSSGEHSNNKSFANRPRLTLSAFRRPEQTIRLTKADPRRTLASEYDLQAPQCGVLGHGAFSTVRLAIRRSDGMHVAVKSIAKHEALRSRRLRRGGRSYLEEWEILRRFHDHPYVITLLDVLENDDEIQLVTEYCQGGELFDAIQKKKKRWYRSNNPASNSCNSASKNQANWRRSSCGGSGVGGGQYSEAQSAQITSQILMALADLHAQNIVHRDVKPENILLVNDDETRLHAKLCDFGVARPLLPEKMEGEDDHSSMAGNSASSNGDASPITPGRSRSFSTIGTDYYAAPEISLGGGSYTAAVDVYSLGVTLYILLCGFPPVFSSVSANDNGIDEVKEVVVFPNSYWIDISESAKNLLRQMLNYDASGRISAKDALSHPWIKTYMTINDTDATVSKVVDTYSPSARRRAHTTFSHGSRRLVDSNNSCMLDLNLVRNQLLRSLDAIQSSNDTCKRKSPYLGTPSTNKSGTMTSIMHLNTSEGNESGVVGDVSKYDTSAPSPSFPNIGISSVLSPFKRARCERRMSSTFLALADLYRGVTATPSGIMAASTAVDDDEYGFISPNLTPRLENPPLNEDSDQEVDTASTKHHAHCSGMNSIAALSF